MNALAISLDDIRGAAGRLAGVAHRTQNKLIARLAPMRPDIIYH